MYSHRELISNISLVIFALRPTCDISGANSHKGFKHYHFLVTVRPLETDFCFRPFKTVNELCFDWPKERMLCWNFDSHAKKWGKISFTLNGTLKHSCNRLHWASIMNLLWKSIACICFLLEKLSKSKSTGTVEQRFSLHLTSNWKDISFGRSPVSLILVPVLYWFQIYIYKCTGSNVIMECSPLLLTSNVNVFEVKKVLIPFLITGK